MTEEARRLHPQLPHREVTEPDALRALAHPLRMQLLDCLTEHGPATASELANKIDDTQANCSWHLRQLHKYGLIEEEPGGTSRRRPWRLVPQTLNLDVTNAGDESSATGMAATALSRVMLGRQLDALHQWHLRRGTEPEQWRNAAHQTTTWSWMTAEELHAFTTELNEVMDRHIVERLDRIDPTKRPDGCRAVRHVSWSIPGDPGSETDTTVGAETTHGDQDEP
ncbi:MAG TPA: helix-turn-helix domain-containing protein [Candidatus Stackebrandtia faecavium]|nr:helix-turn-helix domain-containing protein [Candidatus Stackebrandtia faecavium]